MVYVMVMMIVLVNTMSVVNVMAMALMKENVTVLAMF
jgi:hypothetical protein